MRRCAVRLRTLAVVGLVLYSQELVTAEDKIDAVTAAARIERLGGGLEQTKDGQNRSGITVNIGPNLTDRYVDLLKAIDGLTGLYNWNSSLTDAGLTKVARLTRLRMLRLNGSNFTDVGVKRLANLKSLTSLELSGPGITDESVPAVCQLDKLTQLDLSSTRIGSNGLRQLKVLEEEAGRSRHRLHAASRTTTCST